MNQNAAEVAETSLLRMAREFLWVLPVQAPCGMDQTPLREAVAGHCLTNIGNGIDRFSDPIWG